MGNEIFNQQLDKPGNETVPVELFFSSHTLLLYNLVNTEAQFILQQVFKAYQSIFDTVIDIVGCIGDRSNHH